MGLTRNNILGGTPTKWLAGTLGGLAARAMHAGYRSSESHFGDYAGNPVGTRHPESFWMASGEGGIAMSPNGMASVTVSLDALAQVSTNMAGAASTTTNAFMTSERLVTLNGAASVAITAPAAYANSRVNVRIGFQPSADENADAVMAALVENGISVKKALQVLLAVAAGKTNIDETGASPVVTFRDQADTTDRVTATMTGSKRINVEIN